MAYQNTFNFTGTFNKLKDDAEHPAHRIIKSKNSDWTMENLNVGMKTGGSYHFLTIQGGYNKAQSNDIFYMTTKKEKKTVPYKQRFTVDMDTVAGYTDYSLDLNEYFDSELKRAVSNDEEAAKLGLTSEKAQELLNDYENKKFRFLSAVDLIGKVEELLNNPEYLDKAFNVTGNVTQSISGGKTYTNYEVRKIRAVRNVEDHANVNMHFLFGRDSMQDIEEDGSFGVIGWTTGYGGKNKPDLYFPLEFRVMPVIKDTEEGTKKALEIVRKRWKVRGDNLKECVVNLNVLNGTEYRTITEEDLSEEERDMIFLGEVTLEELQREYKRVAGDTVKEYRFVRFARGYTKGALETELTMDDVYKEPESEPEETPVVEKTDDDEEFDLFGED